MPHNMQSSSSKLGVWIRIWISVFRFPMLVFLFSNQRIRNDLILYNSNLVNDIRVIRRLIVAVGVGSNGIWILITSMLITGRTRNFISLLIRLIKGIRFFLVVDYSAAILVVAQTSCWICLVSTRPHIPDFIPGMQWRWKGRPSSTCLIFLLTSYLKSSTETSMYRGMETTFLQKTVRSTEEKPKQPAL